MIAYFGGAELSAYRETLHEHGVVHASMNWLNHQRRIKAEGWSIEDNFPEDMKVFVDSGAHTYNRPGVNVPSSEVSDLAHRYYDFIEQNYERIDGFLEFDAVQLGPDALQQLRDTYSHLFGYTPVWHGDTTQLEAMADKYHRVAVVEKPDPDSQVMKAYRKAARVTGLHLIGADRSLLDAGIKWYSCHFSAWYSAQQRGEMFMWAGHQMRRYMPDRRELAVKRHRPLLETLGFDINKINSNDAAENLKLAVWSWTQYFANLEHVPATQNVTPTPARASSENTDLAPGTVGGTDPEWEHDRVTQAPAIARPKTLWPGIGTTEHTVYELDPADGIKKPRTELRIGVENADILSCTGCFLADGCPSYTPGSRCAYQFTTRITTQEQRRSAYDFLIETQVGRVAFMRAAEQRDGGYADKATSAEIDRLGRLLKIRDDMDTASFTVSVKAQQRGDAQPGFLTRFFGRDPQPLSIANVPVVDAEVIGETVSEHVTQPVI